MIKTGALLSCAALALGTCLVYLKNVLIPLLLSKAIMVSFFPFYSCFQYLLEPISNFLHRGPRPCRDRINCCCSEDNRTDIQEHERGGRIRQFFIYCRLPFVISVTISLLVAVAFIFLIGFLCSFSISEIAHVFLFQFFFYFSLSP